MSTVLAVAMMVCTQLGVDSTDRERCSEVMSQCIQREATENMSDQEQRGLFDDCHEDMVYFAGSEKGGIARAIGGFVAGHVGGKIVDRAYDRAKEAVDRGNRRASEARNRDRAREDRARSRATDATTARFDP